MLFLSGVGQYVFGQAPLSIQPPAGRLAIAADGNSPDPDDIGATAVMFGLLKATDLRDRLIHLSHSCDLKPTDRISAEDELRRQKVLDQICRYGVEQFGPFENLFGTFNCRTHQQAAIDDLRDAINNSSENDPLWIIEAGEPDIIGYALEAADASKAKFVHLVSHHPANDNAGDFFKWEQVLAFGVQEHQIGDQNVGLKTEIKAWNWAQEHSDPQMQWIWKQLAYAEQDGVVKFQTNCSDAGMLYWWITGADHGGNAHATPAEIAAMLQRPTARQPNVVFLLSDDQGWTDYGFMDHPHIKTPNIDRLAKAGVLYERGYVTAPLCRPSLASIVTGLYPHQTRVRGNDPLMPPGTNRRDARHQRLSLELRNRMTAPMLGYSSFVKILKQNGYATLQTGKWWEGDPKNHGFTDAMTHGNPTRGGRHGDVGLKIGRQTMKPIYDFVDTAKKNRQPFFIWYGVFLPHAPHNAPERLYKEYQDVAPNESTARYWANVQWLDEGCGQIVKHLKRTGQYENTIFVYTSDNGWVQDPIKKNRSVRSKREPVEAGIRTPIFITQAGKIAPHRDRETLASNIDIAPTILRACGIDPSPEMTGLDLRDKAALQKRNRVFVDVYEHDSDLDKLDDLESGLKARVVIDGWDKLIVSPTTKQLFDLKNDPDDRIDLAEQDVAKVARLSNLIDAWITEAGQILVPRVRGNK